jgi:hypothetical protein
MGPEWLVLVVVVVIVALVAMTGRRAAGTRGSTAGHYDPDAIGRYVLDPATQSYRYELPNLGTTGKPMARGAGPPHRRRRRRRRTDAEGG